jgi:hypothetical protein
MPRAVFTSQRQLPRICVTRRRGDARLQGHHSRRQLRTVCSELHTFTEPAGITAVQIRWLAFANKLLQRGRRGKGRRRAVNVLEEQRGTMIGSSVVS